MMKSRIGYLVPEFPGQTHTWIWRDRRALEELGVEADLVSTRRPKVVCHAWAEKAQQLTHYLVPFSADDLKKSIGALVAAGPKAVARCLLVAFEVKDVPIGQRAKLVALVLVAGRFAAMARERGWSQLHVLSSGDAAHIAAFASTLTGIDYSLTLLASMDGYGPNQREKWLNASFALVMSEKLRAEVQERLGDAAPERIAIAPMGVDLDQARRAGPYEPWQSDGPVRLYTCGRLHPVKGHRFLFEALGLLVAQGREVKLEVAGDEEGVTGYRNELDQQLRTLGLSDCVTFLGAVSEERHREAIASAHVFVLASLSEGISVAAMEAMAMETPSVVTDVGGMRELVDPGQDALMVPAENAAELAAAIARIIDSPELALNLSRQSRAKVACKFHHRRSAQALATCLGVLGDETSPGSGADYQ
jgi:glycosyltransferase involved in cell wall biosynthesis